MTSKVFVSVTMSLDGYIGPESSPEDVQALRRGEMTPGLERWMTQWSRLQEWVFEQRFFRENLHLGDGGSEGPDNAILERTFSRTGASIMGKRMFEAGEVSWPEEAPFHTSVYVLTHEARSPWERPGGTTFHFINDGIEHALELAGQSAGERDVRIAGGGETIVQYLNAGLVDELDIALSPVFFGSGVGLFDGIDADNLELEQVSVEPSSPVTHLTYTLHKR